jgi:transcription initiation factor TFIID subunit 2
MYEICETPKPVLGFCLPGDMELLTNSTSFLPRAMSFYSTEYGLYPFTDFKVVFVNSPRIPCSTSATLAVCSTDLLYPASVIDQAFTTRQTLALSLIQQWVGINIIQRTLADTWIVNGLALYVSAQFLRHLLGNNEYRYRLKKDIDKCARLDQGDKWPLCVPGILGPPDVDFINLKAPLVLHILDRYLAQAGTSLGLSRVIPRIFLSALSDELTGNTLSTQGFFRTCRKICNMDLTSFQDQWVYGSGCPHIKIQTKFVRKKFTIELLVEQQRPAQNSDKRPTRMFEGALTVRIHEADGAPFEHLVEVKQEFKIHSLPFNTKYKRTRRSGHTAARFNKLQADLEETNEVQEEDLPEEMKRSEVFAYPPWDDEVTAVEWRVADWSDRQAVEIEGESGGYEWMRIDPEIEWIASFEIMEKEWYWQSQLRGERDVIAQMEVGTIRLSADDRQSNICRGW